MQLLLAFIFVMFVLGGSVGRAQVLRRPVALLATCAVVGIMFYSRRMI